MAGRNSMLIGKTELVEVHCENACSLLTKHPARLVFMDPPFNYGEDYEHGDNDPHYDLQLASWIGMAASSITEYGSVWINLPDEWAADAVVMARESGLRLWNWCIWHYRFAQCQRHHFLRSKTHALWFCKDVPIVNSEDVLVPSDRAAIYGDYRTEDSVTPGERMDFDVWGFEQYWGRVQGNNKERGNTPNQLPEKYLERIIKVCTDPGDLVVDPFGGSGTTAVVCQALRRRCIIGDIGKFTCEGIWDRVMKGAVRV